MGSGMVKTYHCLISLVYVYTSPIVWLYLPLSSAILKRELYGYPRGGGGDSRCVHKRTRCSPLFTQVLEVSTLYSGTDTVAEF